MPHLTISFALVATGAMAGLGYAILAVGLVIVYRATRIINLAHGQIGALSAVVLVELASDGRLPYLAALPVALLAGAAIGWVVERVLVRAMVRTSRLAVLVATVGVTEVLLFIQLKMPAVSANQAFPVLVNVNWQIDGLTIRGEHVALLTIGPIVLVATAAFLRWSRYGLSIRAVAENSQAASLAGIPTNRISSAVWVLAGALAACAAVLTLPLTGAVNAATSTPALGPDLLLRALAAAVVGGLSTLPLTVVAGVAIGVLESILYASYPSNPGLVNAVLFVAILVLLLARSRRGTESSDDVALGADPVPLPRDLRAHPVVKRLRLSGAAVLIVIVAVLPLIYSQPSQLFQLSRVPIFAIIGISIVILTGWAGQLSLGQMGFVGIGAMGTAALVARGVPFGAAVVYSTIAGALIAAIIGVPALRLKGLLLAIVTLAFAVTAETYLLPARLFRSNATTVETVLAGKVGPIDFDSYRTLYYTCVLAMAATMLLARRLRTTGVGRRVLAVEGNEDGAAAMGLAPATAKLMVFALSGGIATFAGGLLAAVTQNFDVSSFTADNSLQVLAMAVVGGIGSIGGAVLGAVYVIGVPALFGNSIPVQLSTSGIGLLLVLRFFPGGLMGALERGRDLLVGRFLARPVAPEAPAADVAVGATTVERVRLLADADERSSDVPPRDALALRQVAVALGGRAIVRGVDLEVKQNEIVGLIGANGAGKTTLMNAVSGFVPFDGSIALDQVELAGLSPATRAAMGLGRSFQSATVFPRLSVRECLQVALEIRRRSEVVPTLLALPPSIRAESWQAREADSLIDLMGLGGYADSLVGHLSTGTRRIVELGCLIAGRPSVVLLDEPTAGVAQRETEAFVPLLLEVRRALGAAILLIEHDLPMVMALCDRLYCMEDGLVIASGPPDAVRSDSRVVASYLGTDERSIARSGPARRKGGRVRGTPVSGRAPA